MGLTRNFKDTVMARAQKDPEFRCGLLTEAINLMVEGDFLTCKGLLLDYINATETRKNIYSLRQ